MTPLRVRRRLERGPRMLAAAPDAAARLASAMAWLMISLTDLPRRFPDDGAVLASGLAADATRCLLDAASRADEAAPPDERALFRSERLRAAFDAAGTGWQRMCKARDWLGSSAKVLGWAGPDDDTGARRLDLRDQILTEAADYLAALARLADERGAR